MEWLSDLLFNFIGYLLWILFGIGILIVIYSLIRVFVDGYKGRPLVGKGKFPWEN